MWSFFFPLLFVVIFGSLAQGEERPNRWSVGIVREDTSEASAWIPGVFRQVPVFEAHEGTLGQETQALRRGKRRAVVIFPTDMITRIGSGQTVPVRVLYDATQQQTAPVVIGIVRQVVARIDKEMSGAPTLLETREEPLALAGAARQSGGLDYLLPGVLAMTVIQLGLFTAIPLINLREKGVLKRLRATPLPTGALIGSQVAQRLVIGLAQTLVLIGVGRALYRFQVAGSWLAIGGVVLLGILTFICLGTVLASVARTQESGMPLVQSVNLPMLLLSGLFFPADLLPATLRFIAAVLPSTYLADALRHVMLAAPAAHPLVLDLAVLGAWLLSALFLSSRLFRWE